MNVILYFSAQPQKLLLFDAAGAFFSAMVTGLVLIHFQELLGIPLKALYILAVIPLAFICFDLICLLRPKTNLTRALRAIAVFNTSYCVLLAGLALWHFEKYTVLAWLYITVEIAVILAIAWLEWCVANRKRQQ